MIAVGGIVPVGIQCRVSTGEEVVVETLGLVRLRIAPVRSAVRVHQLFDVRTGAAHVATAVPIQEVVEQVVLARSVTGVVQSKHVVAFGDPCQCSRFCSGVIAQMQVGTCFQRVGYFFPVKGARVGCPVLGRTSNSVGNCIVQQVNGCLVDIGLSVVGWVGEVVHVARFGVRNVAPQGGCGHQQLRFVDLRNAFQHHVVFGFGLGLDDAGLGNALRIQRAPDVVQVTGHYVVLAYGNVLAVGTRKIAGKNAAHAGQFAFLDHYVRQLSAGNHQFGSSVRELIGIFGVDVVGFAGRQQDCRYSDCTPEFHEIFHVLRFNGS